MTDRRYLTIPSAVLNDQEAVELLRVWTTKEDQHFVLETSVWTDPAAWGMLFVDLAKHVAVAYQRNMGKDFKATLNRIREGFDAEWDFPTDNPSLDREKEEEKRTGEE